METLNNTKIYKRLGFDSEETKEVVNNLNLLLANLHVHYQKLRNYHWNVTGAEFFDIHEKTEAEYNEVVLEIDEIAERIRVFGATPISTMSEYLETSEIKETGTDLEPMEMVKEILRDMEILLSFMVDTIEAARAIGDISTDDLVTGFMQRREKIHWMLTSFAKGS
jgi:starvation-inducible DNA-binding protein